MYRRAVERHQGELARLQTEKSREASNAADAFNKAHSAREAATRTTSTSTQQMKIRDAKRFQDKALKDQKKVADLESKIAREQGRLNDAQRQLASTEEREHRRRIQDQQRAMRESERQLSAITGQLSHHGQLHRVALSAIDKLQNLPMQITILFLATNPVDQEPLRLDEEVRLIGEMIRKSEHRNAVRLESRWAVRPLDILQAINELQPRIVHFSGHGSDQDEIVFQDNAGNAKFVSKEAIVQTMAAGSDEIQLVFFNTCYSHGQAEAVVEHISAAIGMKTSIGDEAARIFAALFYSAIGFGLSVGHAFRQARAAVMLEGLQEEDTPELYVTAGLDADDLVFVRLPD